jgi:hypothetical protein
MMAAPCLMPDVERMRDYAGEVFGELVAAAREKSRTAA